MIRVKGPPSHDDYLPPTCPKWHLENTPSEPSIGFQKYDVFVKQGAYHNPKMMQQGVTKTRTGRTASEVVSTLAIEFLREWIDTPTVSAIEAGGTDGAGSGGRGGGTSRKAAVGPGGAGSRGHVRSGGTAKPWLLHVCFKETHESWNYPVEYEDSLPALLALEYPPGQSGPLYVLHEHAESRIPTSFPTSLHRAVDLERPASRFGGASQIVAQRVAARGNDY